MYSGATALSRQSELWISVFSGSGRRDNLGGNYALRNNFSDSSLLRGREMKVCVAIHGWARMEVGGNSSLRQSHFVWRELQFAT
jgi:hypothetical protein